MATTLFRDGRGCGRRCKTAHSSSWTSTPTGPTRDRGRSPWNARRAAAGPRVPSLG